MDNSDLSLALRVALGRIESQAQAGICQVFKDNMLEHLKEIRGLVGDACSLIQQHELTAGRHAAVTRSMADLTDEQIKDVCRKGGWDDSYQSLRFARAVLAAQQEPTQ